LNDGFSSTVSDRAFIIRWPMLASGAQEGTRPHFITLVHSLTAKACRALRPSLRIITSTCCDGGFRGVEIFRVQHYIILVREKFSDGKVSISANNPDLRVLRMMFRGNSLLLKKLPYQT